MLNPDNLEGHLIHWPFQPLLERINFFDTIPKIFEKLVKSSVRIEVSASLHNRNLDIFNMIKSTRIMHA